MSSMFIRVFSAISILCSAAAQADDRVFLLQLGSFETQAEANARWMSLKDTYPDLLDGLRVRLLDVTLPPDNFTVYRTQAGALTNRADAEIICEKLNGRGDECYVVETAMFNPQELQSIAQRSQPMNAQPVRGEQPLSSLNGAEELLPSADTAAQTSSAALLLPETQPQVPSLEAELMAMEQEIDRLDQTPAIDMNAGAGLEPLENESKESFWSWLNPFSGKEQPQDAVPVDQIEYVDAQPMAPPAGDVTLQLPPPPAPPAGYQSPQMSVAEAMPQPAPQPRAVSSAASAASTTNLPFQVKRDGKLVSPAVGYVPAGDKVKVAEAVSVPVTTGSMQSASPARLSVSTRRKLGMPSQPQLTKQLWAEVHYFNSQQAALAFWEGFRRANSSLPPLRVRVTNPYINASAKSPRVSLRVGPFEYAQQIRQLCSAVGEPMRCGIVRDLGRSTASGSGRYEGAVTHQAARYRQATSGLQMYWVQLGGFGSAGEANAAWKNLMMRHDPFLNELKPSVVTPNQTSATKPVYRLRTGPYAMRPMADSMCDQLKMQGTSCRTIFAN